MKRREFVGTAMSAGIGLWAGSKQAPGWKRLSSIPTTQSPDSRIEVLIEEPIGTIAPEIYGHFAEHLGGVIYDGIWVGENSKIPNIGGIRKSLVEAMRKIRPAVIRWPGGCFADSYNWRDGIGPKTQRARQQIFGATPPSGRRMRRTALGNTRLINSARMTFCAFAAWSGRNPIWRQTCAVCRLKISTNGLSTATHRLVPLRSPIFVPPTAIASRRK
ncbi:MAG TPA: hypothetical protein VE135_13175 [Pyrinomonadaceae bacterium]|nr:hypothetical protein [Pyrinomonadaceae bacterium]